MGSSRGVTVRIGPGLKGGEGRDRNAYSHQKIGLDLELFINHPAFYWIVLHLLVEAVAPGCFDDTRGEDLKRTTMRIDNRDHQMSGSN